MNQTQMQVPLPVYSQLQNATRTVDLTERNMQKTTFSRGTKSLRIDTLV